MKDKLLAQIEEKLASLEAICENTDLINNESERRFVEDEIKEKIGEMNKILQGKEVLRGELVDRLFSVIAIYNRRVADAKDKGIIKDSGIDTIEFYEELQ